MFCPFGALLFMPETDLLAPIFQELIGKADRIAALDRAAIEDFCGLIGQDPTFVPELVNILGPDTFLYLVHYFGGKTFTIPEVSDILDRVKLSKEQNV